MQKNVYSFLPKYHIFMLYLYHLIFLQVLITRNSLVQKIYFA